MKRFVRSLLYILAIMFSMPAVNAMQQEQATWHALPFELQLNTWGQAENKNFCAKIRLLNKFRLVCTSWNSALRNDGNLKAFFEHLFLKDFTEPQCKAVKKFLSFVLSDQNTNPAEKDYLKRLFDHFKPGTNTLAQLINDVVCLRGMAMRNADKAALCFLTLGANKEAVDSFGRTALHFAASRGHREIVRLFLTQGADKEAKNKIGWTALHMAANEGNLEIVGLLLTHSVNKDVLERNGWSPLHMAVSHGRIEIVKLLLLHNVNTTSRINDDGRYSNMTAADIANAEFIGTGREVFKDIFNLLRNSHEASK